MRAAARVNRAARAGVTWACAVLALGACGSSPNGPTGPYANGGTDPVADAAAPEAGASETGVGLGCPSSYAGRAEGTPCFSILPACDYLEGRCGCQICAMGMLAFGYAWTCRPWDSGGDGCPSRSPPLGSACSAEGLVCRYAAYCSVSVGDDLTCKDGTWQPADPRPPCGSRSCPS